MTRRRLRQALALVIVALCSCGRSSGCADPLNAQSLGVHGGAGAAVPMADLGDYADAGWILFGGINRQLGPALGADVTAFFGEVSHNDEENASTQIPGLAVGGRYGFGAGVAKPYGGLSVGLLQHRYKSELFEESTETKPFVAVGAGLRASLAGLSVFADSRYVAADGTSFIGIIGGVSFGGGSR